MSSWYERTSFPAELGRHFLNRTEPEITFVTFHADGPVVVHGDSQEATDLIERLLAAGYQDESTGIHLVRSFVWPSDQPQPDAVSLVFAHS